MLREMYRDQRYLDVITMFKNKSATTAVTEWDYSFYMNSLYKLNKYKECLACYKEFVSKFKDSNLLNDKMGWAVYQLYVKDIEHKNVNINNLLNIAVYVINKSTDTEYSPKSTVFRKFVEFLLEKGNESKTDWFRLKSFLEQINPDCLSRAEKVYSIDGGKQMRGASDVEYWYSRMTKALFALEEFEECIDVCNEGLNVLNKFHNNNDIWFNYRKAKCLFSLNKANEAATIVEEILNSGFSSEHLLMLMFQIEACRGNFDEAMRYAAKSALFNREHQKRLKFYEEFASYLEQNDYKEEAMLHRRLVVLIRQENEWRLMAEQENWWFDNDIQQLSKIDVLKKLTKFWLDNKNKGRILLEGKVTKLLAEGKSGFITSENGERYYFNVKDFLRRENKIVEGAAVEFFEENRLDKSKNQMSKVAAEIKIV